MTDAEMEKDLLRQIAELQAEYRTRIEPLVRQLVNLRASRPIQQVIDPELLAHLQTVLVS